MILKEHVPGGQSCRNIPTTHSDQNFDSGLSGINQNTGCFAISTIFSIKFYIYEKVNLNYPIHRFILDTVYLLQNKGDQGNNMDVTYKYEEIDD